MRGTHSAAAALPMLASLIVLVASEPAAWRQSEFDSGKKDTAARRFLVNDDTDNPPNRSLADGAAALVPVGWGPQRSNRAVSSAAPALVTAATAVVTMAPASGSWFPFASEKLCAAGDAGTIALDDFVQRMLRVHPTARVAFAALDAKKTDPSEALLEGPVTLAEFIQGVKRFVPPLTEAQAVCAFKSFDSDHSGSLELSEFLGVLQAAEFLGSGSFKSGGPALLSGRNHSAAKRSESFPTGPALLCLACTLGAAAALASLVLELAACWRERDVAGREEPLDTRVLHKEFSHVDEDEVEVWL